MMKKQFSRFSLLLLGSAMLTITACEKDDHDHEHNEEEVITTVQLNFVPVGGGNTLTYKFDDPDGDGGAAPTKDQIVLAANKTYNVTLLLLNKTVNPAADITAEIAAEADAHRFYFQPSGGANIAVSNLNNDAGGIPLGITSTWTTTAAASGTMKVTLRHYGGNPPNKEAGDPVNSSKSATDVEVEFNTTVQ